MPTLQQLEKQLNAARFDAQDIEQRFGRISVEAVAARKHLNECESRYRSELFACTIDG